MLRLRFSAKNPLPRKALNRYGLCYGRPCYYGISDINFNSCEQKNASSELTNNFNLYLCWLTRKYWNDKKRNDKKSKQKTSSY